MGHDNLQHKRIKYLSTSITNKKRLISYLLTQSNDTTIINVNASLYCLCSSLAKTHLQKTKVITLLFAVYEP